jgi:hypothetical protein
MEQIEKRRKFLLTASAPDDEAVKVESEILHGD